MKQHKKKSSQKIKIVERIVYQIPELMNRKKVAEFLGVTKMTIYRWVKDGKLNCIRINNRGDMRFRREDVEALLGERNV